MNTASVIAITAFVAVFVLLLLGAAGFIIWLLIRLHSTLTSTSQSLKDLTSATDAANLAHREALITSLADHQKQLSLTLTTMGDMLSGSRKLLDAKIDSINGRAITEAVSQFLIAAKSEAEIAQRIERACINFAELAQYFVNESATPDSALQRARDSGLAPESYAPAAPGERFATTSRTAAGDQEAALQELLDNAAPALHRNGGVPEFGEEG